MTVLLYVIVILFSILSYCRSLQLKFHTLLFTGVLFPPRYASPPTHLRSSKLSASVETPSSHVASGFVSPNESLSEQYHFCPTSKIVGSPNLDHCATSDAVFTWSIPDSSADLDAHSDNVEESRRNVYTFPDSTFVIRVKLNRLRMLNGWDDERNCCALDFSLNSVVMDACVSFHNHSFCLELVSLSHRRVCLRAADIYFQEL